MGLFDSIRRVVGRGDDGTAAAEDATPQPDLVDTHELSVSTLRERAVGVAEEVSVLDFSLDSLEQFDDAIDAGYDEALATADEPGTYATDAVRFGCYLGEVLVRVYGGEWTRDPDWGVTIAGPDGTTTVVVFDVAERSITTGAVFAAVADRAAGEIGLEGAPADSGDHESSGDAAATAVDDEGETAPGDDPPTTDASSDDPPTTATPEVAADETTPSPDPVAAEPTPSETDRGTVDAADTASLIEEAEPETAADDDPGAQTAASEATPPSLFDDDPTSTGPTVADAPEADDGPLSGPSGPGSADVPADTDREAATVGDAASVTEADSGAVPSDDPATDGDDRRATYAEAADDLVSFWTEYDLDYTPDSLERLDALVGDEWDDDRFDEATFGSDDTFDDRVFTGISTELGSYFGEVLVRELDAEWSDEAATDGVVVAGADGPLAVPVFEIAGTAITQQPVFARSYASLRSDLDSDG